MDAAEFKQQFLPYHRKLYRTAFRLTENPQEAEDMVQEAYLKLWNKRGAGGRAEHRSLLRHPCQEPVLRRPPQEPAR